MALQENLEKVYADFRRDIVQHLNESNKLLTEKSNAFNTIKSFDSKELEFLNYVLKQGVENIPTLMKEQYDKLVGRVEDFGPKYNKSQEILSTPGNIETVVFKQDDKVGLLLPVKYDESKENSEELDLQTNLLAYSAACFGQRPIYLTLVESIQQNYEGFVRVYGDPIDNLNTSFELLKQNLNNGGVPCFKETNLSLVVSDLDYFNFPFDSLEEKVEEVGKKPSGRIGINQKIADKYGFDPEGEYCILYAAEILGISDASMHTVGKYSSLITKASKGFKWGNHKLKRSVKGRDLVKFLKS